MIDKEDKAAPLPRFPPLEPQAEANQDLLTGNGYQHGLV